MITISTQRFYEKHTGDPHEVTVKFRCRRYEIHVDGLFYSIHDKKADVYDEIVDIIKIYNWTPINPI